MFYKHREFVLNNDNKKVFDENGKELRLTGNAYRMLEFLCKNKSANLTEIGDFFDWVKDYTENHIRQYRYKINTIIGTDVVEYRNGIYSLVGELEELDKLDRNTDLLQPDTIKSRKSIMEKLKDFKITIIPGIIAIVLLFLSFLDWPYGYYTFLRFVITGVAVYYIYCLYIKEKLLTILKYSIEDNAFVKASSVYVNKQNYKGDYLSSGTSTVKDATRFRHFITRRLLEFHFQNCSKQSNEIEIIVDRFHSNEIKEQQMRNYLRKLSSPELSLLPSFLHIIQADSRYLELLQIVDWVAGSVKEKFFIHPDRNYEDLFKYINVKEIIG